VCQCVYVCVCAFFCLQALSLPLTSFSPFPPLPHAHADTAASSHTAQASHGNIAAPVTSSMLLASAAAVPQGVPERPAPPQSVPRMGETYTTTATTTLPGSSGASGVRVEPIQEPGFSYLHDTKPSRTQSDFPTLSSTTAPSFVDTTQPAQAKQRGVMQPDGKVWL
jgi:hypothetical protein